MARAFILYETLTNSVFSLNYYTPVVPKLCANPQNATVALQQSNTFFKSLGVADWVQPVYNINISFKKYTYFEKKIEEFHLWFIFLNIKTKMNNFLSKNLYFFGELSFEV